MRIKDNKLYLMSYLSCIIAEKLHNYFGVKIASGITATEGVRYEIFRTIIILSLNEKKQINKYVLP